LEHNLTFKMRENKQENTELCKKYLVELVGEEKAEKIVFNTEWYGRYLYINDIRLFHELSQKIKNDFLFHYPFGLQYFLLAPKKGKGLRNNNWIVVLPNENYDEFRRLYKRKYEVSKQF